MAKIYLVGGKSVSVSQEKAEKLLAMKSGKDENGKAVPFDKNHLIDIGQKDFITIGQIRRIDFETGNEENPVEKERSEKILKDMQDWDAYVKRCRAENPEEKARRTVNSFCKLLWIVRKNIGEMPEDIQDDLMIRIIPYFATNPDEWHATSALYQDLIPFGDKKVVVSTTPGVKSIGEMMMNPPEVKDNKQKASCDICQKPFEYEGVRPLFCPKCEEKAKEEVIFEI